MNEDKILLCLLSHVSFLTGKDEAVKRKLQKKVAFSQMETDLCLQLGYLRQELVSETNSEGVLLSYVRIVVTLKGTEHIGCLWSVSQYNRKWYQRIFQFSWEAWWTVFLTALLSYLISLL